jgi:hypothetical protein
MSLIDFVKRADADLDEQEGNFLVKILIHAATVDILPAEVTSVTGIITEHRDNFKAMILKKAEVKASVSTNLDSKIMAVAELRRIAKKIKASPGYTDAIGKDLGIVGPDIAPPDMSTVKPKLIAVVAANAVTVKFDKGDMEGVRIYSKRGSETHFTFLGTDTHSPYHDNRPKLVADAPEERQYFAFYFQNDYEVGQQSDIITAVLP